MTNLEAALANLEAEQDAFTPIANNLKIARAALKRSKSKANIAAFVEAEAAFDAHLDITDAAHESVAAAEILDQIDEAIAAKAAEDFAQPTFI